MGYDAVPAAEELACISTIALSAAAGRTGADDSSLVDEGMVATGGLPGSYEYLSGLSWRLSASRDDQQLGRVTTELPTSFEDGHCDGECSGEEAFSLDAKPCSQPRLGDK